MNDVPTIRYSKGFNCLILEDATHLHYFTERPGDYVALFGVLRRWAERAPTLHAALDHRITTPEAERLKLAYIAEGGQITSHRVKLRLSDLAGITPEEIA